MTGRASGEHPEFFTRTIPAELSDGASAERFAREIAPATTLVNSHIAPVLETGTTRAGLLYYTMRFVAGEWLPVRLQQGRLPLPEILGLLSDVASALDFAHKRGIVHGSLAPDKVILSFGSTVVTDFGVALALVRARGRPLVFAHVEHQPTIGDPAYLAPEQHHGTDIGPLADVYAWGVLAYEMLGGSHPFASRMSTREQMEAHAHEPPVHLLLKAPDLPATVSSLVMACLEKDPDARPASAAELLRVLDDESLLGQPDGNSLTDPAKTPWTTRVVGVFICIVAAFLAFGGPRLVARIRGISVGADSTSSADSLAATGKAITSIAVLPFQSADGSADDYLSEGLTRELAHALSLVPRVTVAGWRSAGTFKAASASPLQVAKTLGVAAMVIGSVQQTGTTVRASVQLVDARGKQLWTGAFDRPTTELFQLQDDFTRGIVSSIVPGLKGVQADRFSVRGRGTENAGAYDLFLQARHGLAIGGYANVQRAIASLTRALELDPIFTRAAAAQARAYLLLASDTTANRDSTLQSAVAAARRAISLDLGSADAHMALGDALSVMWRFTEAGVQYQSALEQVPGDATIRFEFARNLLASGKVDRAITEAQLAARQDPLSPVAANLVADALLDARKFAEALIQASVALALDTMSTGAMRSIARAYVFSGHADSAIIALQPRFARDSTSPGLRATLFLAYAAAGRKDDAGRLRAGLVAESAHQSDYDAVMAALVDDNNNAALSAFARSAAHGGDIATLSESLGCDPLFDKLKSDPQFTALMTALGLAVCPASTPWPVAPVKH